MLLLQEWGYAVMSSYKMEKHVYKQFIQTFSFIFFLSAATMSFAATTIVNTHPCTMKNLDILCENGDKIKVDVIRSTDQRGEVFLNINTKGTMGNQLLLYIDGSKPEVLRVEKGTNTVQLTRGAFISRDIIMKLKDASSVHFKIAMKQRSPITGNLDENHFNWLKRFGEICE